MNIRILLVKVVLGVLLGAVLGTIILGLVGFIVASWAGLLNGTFWGFFLGIFGGVLSAGAVEWSYWSAFMTRLGRSLQKGECARPS